MNRVKIVKLIIVLGISLLSFIAGIGITLTYQQVKSDEDRNEHTSNTNKNKQDEVEEITNKEKEELQNEKILSYTYEFINGKTVSLSYEYLDSVSEKQVKEINYENQKELQNKIFEDFKNDYDQYLFYLVDEDAYYEPSPNGLIKKYLIDEQALNKRLETTVNDEGMDEVTKFCSIEDKIIKGNDFKVLTCETEYKSKNSDTDYVRTVEDKFCMYPVGSEKYFIIEKLQAPMGPKNTCEFLETNLVSIEVE